MYALLNQQKSTEAFIEKNRIVASDSLELIGILLGNCVFDRNGKMIGKYLDNVLYHLSGKILAKGEMVSPSPGVEARLNRHQEEGDRLLRSIKNHTDTWIYITNEWDTNTLVQVLSVSMQLV